MTEKAAGIAGAARAAARRLAKSSAEDRRQALVNIAAEVRRRQPDILEANAIDLAAAEGRGLSAAMIDRLRLTPDRLAGITERYVILSGAGRVEVGDHPAQHVTAEDVVLIPPGCRQRITNTGDDDLVFLAVCTPRFRLDAYDDIDPSPKPPDRAG